MNTKELDKKYVANTYNRFPVEIVCGKGATLTDENGKEYIDMGAGIAVVDGSQFFAENGVGFDHGIAEGIAGQGKIELADGCFKGSCHFFADKQVVLLRICAVIDKPFVGKSDVIGKLLRFFVHAGKVSVCHTGGRRIV